jgi:uncharacterized protein YecT (DUF1311 family)
MRLIGSLVALLVWSLSMAACCHTGAKLTVQRIDCRMTSTATEREICRNPGLSRLDDTLASTFENAVSKSSGARRTALIKSENAWIRLRDRQCGGLGPVLLGDCLSQSYRARIAELNQDSPPRLAPGEHIGCDSILSERGFVLHSPMTWGVPLSTTCTFRPPVDIQIVAMTDSTNLRIGYAAQQIIFNWELDPAQLRIDGGPADGLHQRGKGAIPSGQYVSIHWVVTSGSQDLSVNGERRFHHEGDYSQIDLPVFVYAANGSTVTVKSIVVHRLGSDR